MGVEIKRAESGDELEAVFRFRYDVYVRELGRRQRYADSLRRWVCEPLDERGHVFTAMDDGRVVGTLRSNYGHAQDLAEYAALFGIHASAWEMANRISVTSKLMVAGHYRGTSLCYRLARATFTTGRAWGVHHDFIDVNPPVVGFFTRLGYRPFRHQVNHPEYGRVHVMRLAVHDLDHMQRVGSPFLPLARRPLSLPLRQATNDAVPHEALP